MTMPRALTIAGSDSSGGAGIQADLKTFTAFGVFGMTAVTAVTAQNTLGVQGVFPLAPAAVVAQIDSVVTDIGVDAAKTGMLADIPLIGAVVASLRQHRIEKLVVDPVMMARSGDPLIAPEARAYLCRELVPLAAVTTPNLLEAEAMTGHPVRSRAEMQEAARRILAFGARAVVVKGGRLPEGAIDLLATAAGMDWLEAERLETQSTHGTGCTFAAAVCAGLAAGRGLAEAVAAAKAYVYAAIRQAPGLGHGHGPVNHLVPAR